MKMHAVKEDSQGIEMDPPVPMGDIDKVDILVVDDLPEKLLAYESILEDLGQNLVFARSGEEALKLVLKQEFAVILLDVNMPGVDGFETAALIRQRKKSSHTPIIFLTAFTDEIRMAQGYASGAVDYLPTPVVPEVLRAKVRVFIELSYMRRRAALQAKEYALRTAAEKATQRSLFLADASEKLTRAHQPHEIATLLAAMPLGHLAGFTLVWLKDKEKRHIWFYRGQLEGDTHQIDLESAFSSGARSFEKICLDALQRGEPQTHIELPAGLIPVQLAPAVSLLLPFVVRGQMEGALLVVRSAEQSTYTAEDASLLTDLIARASVALENVILMERIRETDRRKDEFLATLAHELRNPLAPIGNALQAMRLSSNEKRRLEAQEAIERQLKQMIRLVDDLMDASRITQGKIELRKQPTAINAVLEHAIETTQPLIEQRGHRLSVAMESRPIWVQADPARLAQIFSNLLNNAAKYTGYGGAIELTTRLADGHVIITVSDNGIGIPSGMLEHIFDMFLQIDNTLERSEGGLGIGLTLVKSFVEMHGGTIEAASDGLNKGSKFVVRLPTISEPHLEEVGSESKLIQEESINLRVLVVDDNAASAQTLGWMLEFLGHEAKVAHSGQSALMTAEQFKPHVILLDIGLPGMNGYEICKLIRQNENLKHAVLIAQTGWGQDEHRKRSKEAGFDHHLVKPIDIQVLEKLLHAVQVKE